MALILAAAGTAPARGDDANERLEFFERRVRPVFVDHCHGCHSAETKAAAGLRVDDRAGLLAGGDRGPAIVPGDPNASLLIRAVRRVDAKVSMPPDGRLSAEQIADLERWIADGAVWPAVRPSDEQGGWNADSDRLRREHWSLQPLQAAPVPAAGDEAWPRDAVDRFVLAALEENDLHPVDDADRRTLGHRLFADLTGLRPTEEELDAFVGDGTSTAAASLVDRLLASPAFGERWGRHWLDVARYGESTGSARNLPYPHAWRYRDYVINAFNGDLPYDRFIREQIAGDLLPAESPTDRDRQLIATGFLALGVKDVNQRFKVRFVMDNVDEQIDTVGKAVLALTVSCARCHDHKFDPIPTTDYYALAGIFCSTDICAGVRNKMGGGGLDYYDPEQLIVLDDAVATVDETDLENRIAAAKKEYDDAREAFEKIRGTPEGQAPAANGRSRQQVLRQAMNRKQQQVLALTDPAARGSVAHGVRDASAVGDTEIRVRGEAEKLGALVPRGFLTAVEVPDANPIDPSQSGRLQLAEWLTSPRNPLTARVAVNRIWQRLFGEGLVRTVDNFGVTGDKPSHPALLDYLATEFIRDGWSTKRLIRRLVLTRTYGLSAVATADHLGKDPSNRLLWRHTPRRLDAEEIRDAMLAVAGRLDRSGPGDSPAKSLQVIELRNNGPEAAKILAAAKSSTRRSVYLPLLRTLVPESLAVFDAAEQAMVTGRRELTTVSPQSLFMLNDPFVLRQSLAVAERLLGDTGLDDPGRVAAAYRAVLGRNARAVEIDRALVFLADHERLGASAPVRERDQSPSSTAAAIAAEVSAADVLPANPDDIDQVPVPVLDEVPLAADANGAAWAAFVQVLFASAEFRYLR